MFWKIIWRNKLQWRYVGNCTASSYPLFNLRLFCFFFVFFCLHFSSTFCRWCRGSSTLLYNKPFAGFHSRATRPAYWDAKVALRPRPTKGISLNRNFHCLSWPSATFASQYAGFVPREWKPAKGLLSLCHPSYQKICSGVRDDHMETPMMRCVRVRSTGRVCYFTLPNNTRGMVRSWSF